jgi:hypothetical protein
MATRFTKYAWSSTPGPTMPIAFTNSPRVLSNLPVAGLSKCSMMFRKGTFSGSWMPIDHTQVNAIGTMRRRVIPTHTADWPIAQHTMLSLFATLARRREHRNEHTTQDVIINAHAMVASIQIIEDCRVTRGIPRRYRSSIIVGYANTSLRT